MRIALEIAGAGAVTAAGLTARQTCAAFRAGLAGFSTMHVFEPMGLEQTVARIPAHWTLRWDPAGWLVALASRALREALEDAPSAPARTLFLIPPEGTRAHPALAGSEPAALLARVAQAANFALSPASRVIDGGPAAALGALAFAAQAIESGKAAEVLLLGVDSFLNPADLSRLRIANRLLGPDNPQGLVPGEGASALRLGPRGAGGAGAPVLLGVATTREPDTVAGPRFSQGRALLEALRGATAEGALEPHLDWVLTNANGERYAAWEALLARTRFFRTRRETLPVVHPAMSVGETGSAAPGLALLIARDAFLRGHAPGRVALCDAGSEGGLRSAAFLGRPA